MENNLQEMFDDFIEFLMKEPSAEEQDKYLKKIENAGDRYLMIYNLYANLGERLIDPNVALECFISHYTHKNIYPETYEYALSQIKDYLINQDGYTYDGEDEIVEVYRGVSSMSEELEKAISWTTDKDIAYWFACRFGGGRATDHKIITAKVCKSDIVAYCDNRSEKEALVLFGDIREYSIEDVIYDDRKVVEIKKEKLTSMFE